MHDGFSQGGTGHFVRNKTWGLGLRAILEGEQGAGDKDCSLAALASIINRIIEAGEHV